MDELLKDFLTETTEHIEGAETQLVQFERNPSDQSLISSIFRLVHTIKGTSSFLGLDRLEKVGHAAESVMGMLRDGSPPTELSVTLILAAIDRIKTIIEDIARTGGEPAGDDSEIINALEAYFANGPGEVAAPAPKAAPVQQAAPAEEAAEAPEADAPVAEEAPAKKAKEPSALASEKSSSRNPRRNPAPIRIRKRSASRSIRSSA